MASVAGTGLFVFVIVTASVFKEFLQQLASGRITPLMAAELVGLLIPYALAFALPMGLLIGILVVLGRMSARLEITAMKAAGLSLWRISAPIVVLAIMGVCFSGYITNFYAPAARGQYKEILRDVVRNEPLRFITPRTFITDFPGVALYIGEIQGNTLYNVWAWELSEDKKVMRWLKAERGTIDYDVEEESLILTVYEASVELRNEEDLEDLQANNPTPSFGKLPLRLSLEELLGEETVHDEAHEIDPRNTDLNTLIGFRNQLRAAERTGKIPRGYRMMDEVTEDRFRMDYQIQRNFASAFGVLSLVLLAIPLGIKASRSETMANFALALMLAMAFYLLQILVDWQVSKPELRPDLLVWLPNFGFQGLGLFLLWRADRY